jgi:hypothetical protein
MAERFGGKYSPDGATRGDHAQRPPLEGKVPARMGARLNLLFVAPFLLLLPAFGKDPIGLALTVAGFADLMLAAWLTREGIKAEDAYNARKIARRPALPRKMLASLLTGTGLAMASFMPGGSLLNPIVLGLLGAGLHFAAFGADPLRDKGTEGMDTFQTDRVARVIDEAEKHLSAMRAAITPLNDRRLTARVDGFQAKAREMCRTVENDPRDLTGARKYLGVYLLGARDASVKFAELYARGRDPQARKDYESLLDDLEQTFTARTERMLLDDRTDLDVEIGVLRERLEREGVRTR